jgi:2-keto-4-pentenoate hydratase
MGLGLKDRIAAAADAVASARQAGKHLARLPDAIRPVDLREGYLVQDEVHAILKGAGHGEIVGHKIGATTPVMQQYMEIDHPCAGGIFAPTVHASGATIPYSRFRRVGLECEIAARLGRDMKPAESPFTRDSVARYVESYCAAIELVDDRYSSWQEMGTPSLAADDFFGAGSVLGAPMAPAGAPDLAAAKGRAFVNGVEIAAGTGADVMGHPLEALAWLANHFAKRGQMLRAGEFVSTGSMVKTIWLTPGDRIAIDVAGLGTVEATIAAG